MTGHGPISHDEPPESATYIHPYSDQQQLCSRQKDYRLGGDHRKSLMMDFQ